jgi:hypothetical protein
MGSSAVTPPAAQQNAAAPAKPPVSPPLGLSVSDEGGQLQIRWNPTSSAVTSAARGMLEINDGSEKVIVPLEETRLRGGSFDYTRHSEGVSIRLAVEPASASGPAVQEATTFFGKLSPGGGAPDAAVPAPAAAAAGQTTADAKLREERDALSQEAAKLRSDLAAQTERNKKLERSIEDLKRQMKRDQRRRLENQAPDPLL